MNTILVYDKADDSGQLFAMASKVELPFVRLANQTVAVSELFKSKAEIILVHLDPGPWKILSSEPSKLQGRFVFRFSTQGFRPTSPCGTGRNCFHVNRPTQGDGAFTHDQFKEFIGLLKTDDLLKSLREGTIPSALRPFIQFYEPHLARALHIFMQGRLAQWALDPGHSLRAQASELVGFDAVSVRSGGDFDWIGVLRKMLGSGVSTSSKDTINNNALLIENSLKQIRDELSQRKSSNDTPIKEMKTMLQQWLGATPPSDHAQRIEQDTALFTTLKAAFNALENSLGLAKEGAA